jgi:hypothetical protein
MNRSHLPLALTAAAAAFALALAGPAGAVPVKLPDIQVVGADAVCSALTVSMDPSGGTVLTCVPTGTPPPSNAPQGCVARINNGSSATLSSSGGDVNLMVVCSSPTTLAHSWSRNGVFGANSNANWTDTLPANTGTLNQTTSYQVRVCNTAGTSSDCVTVPSVPLTAIVPPPGGGGGGGTIACASKVIDVDWNAPGRYLTADAGGFAPTDVLVVRFKTGSVPFTSAYARFSGAEYSSSPSARQVTLSPTPCDFTAQPSRGAYNLSATGSNSITFYFSVGTTESSANYYPQLEVNKYYYLNIRNVPGSTCFGTGGCDMFIDFSKPRGT